MKTFLRVLGFARPLGFALPQFVVLTLLATVFSVVNFTVLIPLLQVLFDQVQPESNSSASFNFSIEYIKQLFYSNLHDFIVHEGKSAALYYICLIIVISVFFANLFRYLASLIIAKLRVRVITQLRNKAFEKVSNFDLAFFTQNKKGDVISRLTTDVQEVELSVVATLKVIVKEPLLIIGYFIALFSISMELTFYTLLLIPIAGGVISIIAKKLKKRARKSQEALGRINNVLDESITGMRAVKAFNARKTIIARFSKEVENYGNNNFKIISKFNLASPSSEFLGVCVLALILLIGGSMVLDNTSNLEAAEFIGFLILFSQVLNPAKSMAASFSNINRGLASAERIFHLMDTPSHIVEKPNAQEINELKESINIKNVSFSYEHTPVLKNISLEIKKGQFIALVGPSGGGKTSLADLIPRFYDPTSGAISIDNINIKDLKTESLRNLIGMVTQESILFNDSVGNNISFGNEKATSKQVIAAAKIANAHSFIEELEQGYDTHIGERGLKLSGGQRQRVCIARAILKNAPILILDEATSALDSASEKLVQDAVFNLLHNRTALVIAHRLSTIQQADYIYVIENGTILECGNHQELLAKNGLYKKLTLMQSV